MSNEARPRQPRTDRREVVTSIVLLLASLSLSLLVAEAALRALTPFPVTEFSNRAPDPRFGYVVSGNIPDVDEHGFRSAGVALEDADVVVVGDSHTYGYNVDAAHAFPAVLGQITGSTVYAMGVGGYGIYHYLALLASLEGHSPGTVVLALYPANDLSSACSIVTLPSWQALAQTAGIEAPPCASADVKDATMMRQSALLGAIHYVWLRFVPARCEEPAIRIAGTACLAVKRIEKHAGASSLANPDNRRHLANAFAIIDYAHARLARSGIRVAVLIIPSRERVLAAWAKDSASGTDPRLERLVAAEVELTRRFDEFLRSRAIPTRDAIPEVAAAFASATARGSAFYPGQDDGHPFEEGYAAYAAAAAALLDQSVVKR